MKDYIVKYDTPDRRPGPMLCKHCNEPVIAYCAIIDSKWQVLLLHKETVFDHPAELPPDDPCFGTLSTGESYYKGNGPYPFIM